MAMCHYNDYDYCIIVIPHDLIRLCICTITINTFTRSSSLMHTISVYVVSADVWTSPYQILQSCLNCPSQLDMLLKQVVITNGMNLVAYIYLIRSENYLTRTWQLIIMCYFGGFFKCLPSLR